MPPIAKHVIFRGRVQGVGFRYTTHRAASQYGLGGFVRNLPDGSVEALLQGTEPDIQACLGDIREYFGGYLRDIVATDQAVDPRYHDFRITY